MFIQNVTHIRDDYCLHRINEWNWCWRVVEPSWWHCRSRNENEVDQGGCNRIGQDRIISDRGQAIVRLSKHTVLAEKGRQITGRKNAEVVTLVPLCYRWTCFWVWNSTLRRGCGSLWPRKLCARRRTWKTKMVQRAFFLTFHLVSGATLIRVVWSCNISSNKMMTNPLTKPTVLSLRTVFMVRVVGLASPWNLYTAINSTMYSGVWQCLDGREQAECWNDIQLNDWAGRSKGIDGMCIVGAKGVIWICRE